MADSKEFYQEDSEIEEIIKEEVSEGKYYKDILTDEEDYKSKIDQLDHTEYKILIRQAAKSLNFNVVEYLIDEKCCGGFYVLDLDLIEFILSATNTETLEFGNKIINKMIGTYSRSDVIKLIQSLSFYQVGQLVNRKLLEDKNGKITIHLLTPYINSKPDDIKKATTTWVLVDPKSPALKKIYQRFRRRSEYKELAKIIKDAADKHSPPLPTLKELLDYFDEYDTYEAEKLEKMIEEYQKN